MKVARILFAILIPPIGVLLTVGVGPQFWLNVLLTILGYIPGLVHALYLVLTHQDPKPASSP